MKKKKVLKIWKGRNWDCKVHLFLGAYSIADACRMLTEIYPRQNINKWRREITVYFSEGCWGDTMGGITPERGVWLQENRWTDHETLKRIYPIIKTGNIDG